MPRNPKPPKHNVATTQEPIQQGSILFQMLEFVAHEVAKDLGDEGCDPASGDGPVTEVLEPRPSADPE
jgi:hypothetical protein